MVTQYFSHPARIPLKKRKELAKLSFGKRGTMYDYILDDDSWQLPDRVMWLERKGKPIAWAARTNEEPMYQPSFMVYVKKTDRRKGWGTYLYQQMTKYVKKIYTVYGCHSDGAAEFYTQIGREDYC